MARIGLFYGSDTGNTKRVAKAIKSRFDDATMSAPIDAGKATPEEVLSYDLLIVGTSTVGAGEMPYDWEILLEKLAAADFSGRTVAVFGLGDQFCYADTFVDAMGALADFFASRGARLVGSWPTEGYEYGSSLAERDGDFVGLVLDEDNQPDRTVGRITAWLGLISPDYRLGG